MIVVGCGKAKLDHAAPASDLYTGSLFRAARRYAEASKATWGVLSAAHGLIRPTLIVRPYDQVLGLRGEALRSWARKAACQIEQVRDREQTSWLVPWGPVELLAGKRYVEPLASELDSLGIEWLAPLEGLGIGHRLQWLKCAAEAAEGGA